MDTALLHAGATAATGSAGVAFSPVPHISINYEFIFLISECWCPHDKLIVSPDPGPSIPEHMPHHSSTSPHLCPVADTRCRLLTCSPPASLVTQGRSFLSGTLWGVHLCMPSIFSFSYYGGSPRSLSLYFLRLVTRRLGNFAVAGHCPWYI